RIERLRAVLVGHLGFVFQSGVETRRNAVFDAYGQRQIGDVGLQTDECAQTDDERVFRGLLFPVVSLLDVAGAVPSDRQFGPDIYVEQIPFREVIGDTRIEQRRRIGELAVAEDRRRVLFEGV